MKKDNYNDAIKRKLESIEPEFQESDWDDMKAFMTIPPITPPLSPFYKPIGYGLAGIAMLTSLYFNARLYNTNNDLAKNNSKESIQQNNKTFEKTSTPEIIYKTDTIYIDRFITKIGKIYVNQILDSDKQFASAQNLQESSKGLEPSINNEPIQMQKEIETKNANSVSKKSDIKLASKIETELNELYINPDKNLAQNTKSPELIDKMNVISDKVNLAKNPDNNLTGNGIEKDVIAFTPYKLETLEKSKGNELKLDKKFIFPAIFKGVKAPEFKSEKSHLVIRIPNINLENSRYRFGVSMDVANEQLAAGITNELVLSKHWGISAGLRIANQLGNEYLTDGEYTKDTKLDFRPTYATFVPQGNEILNIKFDNYFLQLPLGLSYRYPLRNNWTLLFGLGTDLDLAGKQYVTFEYKGSSGEFDEGKNEANISNSVFNNGRLSAGIEKRLGKYVFQALPYVSAQWKNSIYKRDDILGGVKLKIMYQPKWY